MVTRASALLVSSLALLACVWIAGCGGDGDQPPPASADKLVRPRKLEPDIPPPPEPSPNLAGSLEPAAAL